MKKFVILLVLLLFLISNAPFGAAYDVINQENRVNNWRSKISSEEVHAISGYLASLVNEEKGLNARGLTSEANKIGGFIEITLLFLNQSEAAVESAQSKRYEETKKNLHSSVESYEKIVKYGNISLKHQIRSNAESLVASLSLKFIELSINEANNYQAYPDKIRFYSDAAEVCNRTKDPLTIDYVRNALSFYLSANNRIRNAAINSFDKGLDSKIKGESTIFIFSRSYFSNAVNDLRDSVISYEQSGDAGGKEKALKALTDAQQKQRRANKLYYSFIGGLIVVLGGSGGFSYRMIRIRKRIRERIETEEIFEG